MQASVQDLGVREENETVHKIETIDLRGHKIAGLRLLVKSLFCFRGSILVSVDGWFLDNAVIVMFTDDTDLLRSPEDELSTNII